MSDYEEEFDDTYEDEYSDDSEEQKERGIFDVFNDALNTYAEHTSFYDNVNRDYKTLKKSGEKIPFSARMGMFALNEIIHPLDNKQQLKNFKSDLIETIDKKFERNQYYEEDEIDDRGEEEYTEPQKHRSYTREEVEQVLPYMSPEGRKAALFYLEIEEQRRQGKKTILDYTDEDICSMDPLPSYEMPFGMGSDNLYSNPESTNSKKGRHVGQSHSSKSQSNIPKDTSLKYNSSNFSFFSDDIGDDGKFQPTKKKSAMLNRLKANVFNGKRIKIDKSSSILIAKNYEDVKNKFTELGFKNVHTVPLNDIYVGANEVENTVSRVTVDGHGFEKGDELPYTSEVIIHYHSKRRIKFPFSRKEILKMAAIEAEREIRHAGYTNILMVEKKAIFKKPGTIKSVMVREMTSIENGTECDYDVPITIEYYIK